MVFNIEVINNDLGEPTPKQIKYRCWNNGEGEQCERNACGRTWCQQNKERDCRNLPVCTTGPCTWSDWGEWGACSANCKDGIKLRRRTGHLNTSFYMLIMHIRVQVLMVPLVKGPTLSRRRVLSLLMNARAVPMCMTDAK